MNAGFELSLDPKFDDFLKTCWNFDIMTTTGKDWSFIPFSRRILERLYGNGKAA